MAYRTYNYEARVAQREHEAAMVILRGKLWRAMTVFSFLLLVLSVSSASIYLLFMAAKLGSSFACN